MDVEKEVVQKVAKLAYLKLSATEEVLYAGQLGKILEYIDKIENAPDTLPAEWRADTEKFPTLERPDKTSSSYGIQEKISMAAESSGSAFSVPKVIE